MEWTHTSACSYVVTGVDRNGRRFRIVTANPHHALGINLWRGSLWLIENGRRRLLQRVR